MCCNIFFLFCTDFYFTCTQHYITSHYKTLPLHCITSKLHYKKLNYVTVPLYIIVITIKEKIQTKKRYTVKKNKEKSLSDINRLGVLFNFSFIF